MPFAGFDDWDDCVSTMTEERDYDTESAENICGALQAEAKSEHGDPEELMRALKEGAGLIADIGVDLVSGVSTPAVDSKWVMLKSDQEGYDYRMTSPILLSKQESGGAEQKRISYAAALIPREPDKEGDVVAAPTVEKAAHDFLKGDGGVDTDHSLIEGEGDPIESWVLKREREFDLPNGATESYPAGTWMLGIQWSTDSWERIQNGDLSGLSIYGMGEHVSLSSSTSHSGAAKSGDSGSHVAKDDSGDGLKSNDQERNDMAQDEQTDDGDVSVGEIAASLDDLSQTVEAVKEAVETEKQDEQEAAAMLGDAYDIRPGDVLDIIAAASTEDASEVLEAIDSLSDGEEMEQSSDGDGSTSKTETAEKRANEANISKGGGSTQTASKGIDTDDGTGGGLPSYKAAAENYGGD